MKYVVEMWNTHCPDERCILDILFSREEAEALIEKERTNYNDCQEFEITEVY